MTTQSLLTVVVPFHERLDQTVIKTLRNYGDPKGAPYAALANALLQDGTVHFMSAIVVPFRNPGEIVKPPVRKGEPCSHLVIELCADGDSTQVRDRVARALGGPLRAIFAATGNVLTEEQLVPMLRGCDLKVSPGWGHTAGMEFSGTPDLSVRRILAEADLANYLRDLAHVHSPGSALSRLLTVRRLVFADPARKWAFTCEPIARVHGPAVPVPKVTLIWSFLRHFTGPLLPVPIAVFLLSWQWWERGFWWSVWFTMIAAGGELIALVPFLWRGYRRLRQDEDDDVPLDAEPSREQLDKVLDIEDREQYVQNHLSAISIMKKSWVRPTTLRFALWLIAESGARRSQPGYIDKIGTIHFARWLRLPKTDRLVFLSNYDGSWQSYLEDFIARLRAGLTSVWSNTRDFPKTTDLSKGGAEDGSRFKRWARRQQLPTLLWYSAYPNLTAHRIRTNAVIRHGFASATTEQQAAEWLSLLGYAGRDSLETRQIPTLVFGGLSRLRFAHCLVIRLPGDKQRALHWLETIQPALTYGDRATLPWALVAGFTESGLLRLGIDGPALATFPTAFQRGMYKRARVLGDNDKDYTWREADTEAILLIYGESPTELESQVLKRRRELAADGCTVTQDIPTAWLPQEVFEPFGFRDGISQPVMRGTVRESRSRHSPHSVNPGELVLGYRDNLGTVPPVPLWSGQDIGRNGSFLVVRQIEQKTREFSSYLSATAQALAKPKDPRVPTDNVRLLKDWIAAKMVGRWKDGTSLVRFPHEPGTRKNPGLEPDNGFMFGREDPDGLRCPFGAHVRRANPRDSFEPESQMQLDISNRHRILRVGRNYDPLPGQENPGLLFMCVNADIERQFEFLQQSWILGPEFHGLQEEVDPLIGCASKAMVVPTPEGPLPLRNLPGFVTVRGGGYFFMPSQGVVRTILMRGHPNPHAIAASVEKAGY